MSSAVEIYFGELKEAYRISASAHPADPSILTLRVLTRDDKKALAQAGDPCEEGELGNGPPV